MNRPLLILMALSFLCLSDVMTQELTLLNGSFEGQRDAATMPVGWLACQYGTTPDILPGAWGVYTVPRHGRSYVGLITRDDGTWEAIGQKLLKPLEANNCYSFRIDLAHSDTYSGYNLPIRLRVKGGASCSDNQLLWASDLIHHVEWKTYEVKFITTEPINYLILEAYYAPGVFIKYRGNILIDNLTEIEQCDRA